jgi:hypothetical protein
LEEEILYQISNTASVSFKAYYSKRMEVKEYCIGISVCNGERRGALASPPLPRRNMTKLCSTSYMRYILKLASKYSGQLLPVPTIQPSHFLL